MEYPFKDLLPLDEVLERKGYYKDWTHLDPKVFYSLTQISEYIKTKGYGVDVRLLIAQLAEHFGLKTTQVVDLGNLLTAKHATLKTQFEQAVSQVNADRNALENQFNQSVAQMEADKDAVIANATQDSEVILARGGKATLGARLDETTAQLAQTGTTASSLGLIPNNIEEASGNFLKLISAMNDGYAVVVDNHYFLDGKNDTAVIDKDIFLRGINGSFTLLDTNIKHSKSIYVDNILFKTTSSSTNLFELQNDLTIEEISFTKNTFQGNIGIFTGKQNTIDKISFNENVVENSNVISVFLDTCSINVMDIVANTGKNITQQMFNMNRMSNENLVLNIKDNNIENYIWAENTSMYLCFILYVGGGLFIIKITELLG